MLRNPASRGKFAIRLSDLGPAGGPEVLPAPPAAPPPPAVQPDRRTRRKNKAFNRRLTRALAKDNLPAKVEILPDGGVHVTADTRQEAPMPSCRFQKAGEDVVWGKPMGDTAGPSTWRRVLPHQDKPKVFKDDIALCTCPEGHEQVLSGKVHSVSAEGVVSPSYVCPRNGCGFHDYIVLDGWTG